MHIFCAHHHHLPKQPPPAQKTIPTLIMSVFATANSILEKKNTLCRDCFYVLMYISIFTLKGMVTILVNSFYWFFKCLLWSSKQCFNKAVLIVNQSFSRRVISAIQSAQLFVMYTKLRSCFVYILNIKKSIPGLDLKWV